MKKICFFVSFIGVLALLSNNSFAWFRLGQGANVVTQNSGDKAAGISVVVSSSVATQVYSAQAKHREILLQNTSEVYNVYCGTFSTVTAVSGIPRFILPKFPVSFTTNATASIYCIVEPSGISIEVTGYQEWDSKD